MSRLTEPLSNRIFKALVLMGLIVVPPTAFPIDGLDSSTSRCQIPSELEDILEYQDFSYWGFDQAQMNEKFQEIYNSGKRLLDRARWNENTSQYELVYRHPELVKPVPISAQFIKNITNHIERGLELGYFEYVFFPDLGHTHLLINQHFYEESIRSIPEHLYHELYTLVLANPETRFLYHTGEQLKYLDDSNELLPDKYIGWRFFTRNLIARNNQLGILDIHKNLNSIGNTVCTVGNQFRYWSSGFHLSASKDGCFSYRHEDKTYYFDISLSDLPYYTATLGPLARSDASTTKATDSLPENLWGAHGCPAE